MERNLGDGSKKRSTTWKQLIRQQGPGFLAWLESSEFRLTAFRELANNLKEYLLNFVLNQSPVYQEQNKQINKESCELFVSNLPLVLSRCDDDIYDNSLVADAYAYIHLLERYRRFWSVLIELTNALALPLSDQGINVLDIGTGPAPALYAVSDFYQALHLYAEDVDCPELAIPQPELGSVESSYSMRHLFHILSEIGERKNGPFGTSFGTFEDLDLEKERRNRKDSRISQIINEDDTSEEHAKWWVDGNEPWWNIIYRYNLCIFSNFLTQPDSITKFQNELKSVFREIRPGGVIAVVGGKGKQYPRIYEMMDELAAEMHVNRIDSIPENVPCTYGNAYTKTIKKLYKDIWQILERKCDDIDALRANLPSDIWDDNTPVDGPSSFGLRVFRKGKF
ncbi:hypothetical protein ACFL6S_13260 [Candidatus Poribacteria bacterium]